MRKADIVSGAVLCLLSLGLIFYWIPQQIDDSSMATISPRLVPYVAAILTAVLCAILVILRVSRKPTAVQRMVLPPRVLLWTGIVVGVILVSLALVQMVGPLAGALVLPVILLLALGERSPVILVAVPAILTATGWLLLYKILGTALV